MTIISHRCDNCDILHEDFNIGVIKDIGESVDEGGPVPSGQCPDCGALCYPQEIYMRRNFKVSAHEDNFGTLHIFGETREIGALDNRYEDSINTALTIMRDIAQSDIADDNVQLQASFFRMLLGRARAVVALEEPSVAAETPDVDLSMPADAEAEEEKTPNFKAIVTVITSYHVELSADSREEAEEFAAEVWAESADPDRDFGILSTDTKVESVEAI